MTDLNNELEVLEARKDSIKELQAIAPNLREDPLTDEMRKWFDVVCEALKPLIEIAETLKLRKEINILIKCLENSNPATEQRKKTADAIKRMLDVVLSETESRIQYLNKLLAPLPFVINSDHYNLDDNDTPAGWTVDPSYNAD